MNNSREDRHYGHCYKDTPANDPLEMWCDKFRTALCYRFQHYRVIGFLNLLVALLVINFLFIIKILIYDRPIKYVAIATQIFQVLYICI